MKKSLLRKIKCISKVCTTRAGNCLDMSVLDNTDALLTYIVMTLLVYNFTNIITYLQIILLRILWVKDHKNKNWFCLWLFSTIAWRSTAEYKPTSPVDPVISLEGKLTRIFKALWKIFKKYYNSLQCIDYAHSNYKDCKNNSVKDYWQIQLAEDWSMVD